MTYPAWIKLDKDMDFVREIKHDAAGAAMMTDWLGDGGIPVPQSKADERASACLVCPKNVDPTWWERMTKDPIADVIRHQLEIKNSMEMRVEGEAFMGMCQPCGCCTRLKVWVPIKHVKAHTAQDVLESFPAFCWQLNEILDYKGTP